MDEIKPINKEKCSDCVAEDTEIKTEKTKLREGAGPYNYNGRKPTLS